MNSTNDSNYKKYYPDMSYDSIVAQTTDKFLSGMTPDNHPPYKKLASDLVIKTREDLDFYNSMKGTRYSLPRTLNASQIVKVLLKTQHVVNVDTVGDDKNGEFKLPAIYQDYGDYEGIYSCAESHFRIPIRQLDPNINNTKMKSVLEAIADEAPTVQLTRDKDLVAVKNGVFDCDKNKLLDFSHEYIFLSKIPVAYNPNALNVVIHNDEDGTDWDVESWMESLSDDTDIVNLLWEVTSAAVRPNVRWDRIIWLSGASGNNGKGSFSRLLRNLIGNTAVSISLKQFSKEFGLESMIGSNAIIVDEVSVNDYIDDVENLKSAATGDIISINRKHKPIVNYRYSGIILFNVNCPPRFRDKTGSMYRRLLVIPMEHCFTGKERKYIKDDYLNRTEVLEYVLYRSLISYCYELSEPDRCVKALADFKEYNDQILQFMTEMLPQLVWDLVPFSFLYSLYKSWFKMNNPSGIITRQYEFITSVIDNLQYFPQWFTQGRDVCCRPKNLMDKKEYLIAEYDLRDWMNPVYSGPDINKTCSPKLRQNYRGILRVQPIGTDPDDSVESEK